MAESRRQVQGKFGSIGLSDSLLALFLVWSKKKGEVSAPCDHNLGVNCESSSLSHCGPFQLDPDCSRLSQMLLSFRMKEASQYKIEALGVKLWAT
jgi:hypothetical protein